MIGVGFSLLASGAAARPTSPYRHELRRAEAQLRRAMESTPTSWIGHLNSSEDVCALATRASARGDAAAADANWSTLSQLIDELDDPGAKQVDESMKQAGETLEGLRDTYVMHWSDAGRKRALRNAVARVLTGIERTREAVAVIAGSSSDWEKRDCTAATEAIDRGLAQVPPALGPLNSGMMRLWLLV